MALSPAHPARADALRAAGGRTIVETTHRAHVVVADASGRIVLAAGDPAYETPLRSVAKPFQALAMFTSGAAERFAPSDEELALACASHQAEDRHVAVVQAWLARLGLSAGDLACGAHAPGDADAQAGLARAGAAPSALHNNCSGKHTAMLATALALGAPTRDYLRLPHPVQREIVKILSRLLGPDHATPAFAPSFAVDGCSAPTAVLSLGALARLGALLVAPERVGDPILSAGLTRLSAAMTRHADLVGGRDVLDTLLMRSIVGLVAKRGADGVYLMALAAAPGHDAPLGLAVKVEDGSAEARDAVVLATLDALGVIGPAARTALAGLIRAPRKNHRGLVVGRWAVSLSLEGPTP
ncbi:MAG: asparaginase [Deltaproteobacteria bacterium]|nr:asparaginase [Deltaproteobacteria bacterium]